MRVNARLDEATQQQLEYITQATGQSVSHVVRESVAQYYAQVRGQRGPSRLLAMAGTGDSGRSDVASTAKSKLSQILQAKHRLVPPPAASKAAQPRRKASVAR